jgi:hypothetical protein
MRTIKPKTIPRIRIWQPDFHESSIFSWDGITIKQSKEVDAGLGVFATKTIPRFTAIPILGRLIPLDEETDHSWQYYGLRDMNISGRDPKLTERLNSLLTTLASPDTTPEVYGETEEKYISLIKQVNMGLSIAMYVNESTRYTPNCVLKKNFVVTLHEITVGDELYVNYGKVHDKFRGDRYKPRENDCELIALMDTAIWPKKHILDNIILKLLVYIVEPTTSKYREYASIEHNKLDIEHENNQLYRS